jgi:LysR family transcriptional regulator, regulator for bpeEF and oprC
MKSRTLNVQAPSAFTRRLIAPSLPRFLHMHPDLRVVICDANPADGLLAHKADVAICIGQISEPGLVADQIGAVRSVTCASPDFIECIGVPESPADVDPDHCIAVLEGGSRGALQWQFRRRSETYAILPSAPVAFSDCDSAIAAAVRGGGYVRVLCVEAEHQVAAGLLLPVLNDWNDASQPVAMLHARYCDASEEILSFRTFMASIFPRGAVSRVNLLAHNCQGSARPGVAAGHLALTKSSGHMFEDAGN